LIIMLAICLRASGLASMPLITSGRRMNFGSAVIIISCSWGLRVAAAAA
jgi:hypothetical protein